MKKKKKTHRISWKYLMVDYHERTLKISFNITYVESNKMVS